MRVVIVSKAFVVGAYQRKLEELARLPEVELTAIVPPAWHDRRGAVTLQRVFTQGYNLVVAPLVFNGQYHLHFYPTIGRLLRELRPDVLHMDEEPYNLATWQVLRGGQAVGARTLFFTWQNLDRRYPWPFSHFEQANFRRAAHAIAGNRDAVGVLRRKGYHGPVTVIPQFGVDPEVYAPDPAGPSHGPGRCFTIGYAGGLVPEKGVDLLLHACAGLPMDDWSLMIVGDGPERERLGALADQLPGTRGRVRFVGRVPSTETPAVYRQMDVLVLPSRQRPNWVEQFGRVLIEAMACGVPVVGSCTGEIPHVIGDAGMVFPEGNADALRDRLLTLAQNPGRRAALAEAGRARVLAHFTQAQIAMATHQVYREL